MSKALMLTNALMNYSSLKKLTPKTMTESPLNINQFLLL